MYWGPFPSENTGGHIVQEYLLNKMHEESPNHEFYAIPKNLERLTPDKMPYIKFLIEGEDLDYIPRMMSKYHIPLLLPFHISHEVEPVIDSVHNIGGKILMHQTVHFATDHLFRCHRLNDVDWISCPTKWGMKVLNMIGKVSMDKMSVIPHGVDTEKFCFRDTKMREHYRSKNKTVILFSGRLSIWKGVHQIIPLFREFTEKKDCIFIIKASPVNSEESLRLDAILKRISNQNEKVKYMPDWYPLNFVEGLFSSSDILISPTGSEGFNVPLIEAMACKMPVITTSLPNHKEILGEGTAMFVKPKIDAGMADEQTILKVPSVDDLHDALLYLVENPEERQIMGETGRQRVLKYFDLNKVASQWFELMNKLIPEDYSMEKEIMRRMESDNQ